MNYHEIEEKYEWGKWIKKIPFIDFPNDWLIKIIPPYGGAIIRFNVKKNNSNKEVSVYLDCYNSLGYYWKEPGKSLPYWEIYPNYEGEAYRYDLEDIDGLLKGIEKSLKTKKLYIAIADKPNGSFEGIDSLPIMYSCSFAFQDIDELKSRLNNKMDHWIIKEIEITG